MKPGCVEELQSMGVCRGASIHTAQHVVVASLHPTHPVGSSVCVKGMWVPW